jgi:hypothetical protein
LIQRRSGLRHIAKPVNEPGQKVPIRESAAMRQ